MTTTTDRRPLRPRPLGRGRVHPDLFAVVISCALAYAAGTLAIHDPSRVNRLTVVNPTEYSLRVTARAAGDEGHTPVAIIGPGATVVVPELIDQGADWVFHFASQGRDGGEAEITRDDLRSAGWTYTVPEAIARQLRASGAPPST